MEWVSGEGIITFLRFTQKDGRDQGRRTGGHYDWSSGPEKRGTKGETDERKYKISINDKPFLHCLSFILHIWYLYIIGNYHQKKGVTRIITTLRMIEIIEYSVFIENGEYYD